MQVKNNRIYNNDGTPVEFRPTPNKGSTISPIYIVMHYDAAPNATSAINWMTDPKSQVSAHLHISREGEVTQLVPFNQKAWHAGVSKWRGLTGLNSYSIGIELQNTGTQQYTDIQINAAIEVCKTLIANYPIKEIIGHSDIAPGRKPDPGSQFPWAKFKPLIK
ncbi:MAG: N-acetylmuramoyl-L-alanine amidase [Sphingobacterium sp.]|jgi:N-acetylmuramoyl-L-alanine amidase|nr:N-acetylmuramoyl-L-alanine amidase [Sphingobacterium sp.]